MYETVTCRELKQISKETLLSWGQEKTSNPTDVRRKTTNLNQDQVN